MLQAAAQHGITDLALKTDPSAAGSLIALADRIELWPIERLRPYEHNPRNHSDAQADQIAASMVEFRPRRPEDGLTVPLQLQMLSSEHLPLSKCEAFRTATRSSAAMTV